MLNEVQRRYAAATPDDGNATAGLDLPPGGDRRSGFVSAGSAQGAPATAPKAPFDYPGKEKGLALLGDHPLVAETPESLLNDDTTPTAKFFIRNNGQIPHMADRCG